MVKTDGRIRICGDYKVTVNRDSKGVSYPLSQLDDLLAKLARGTKFTKLDMTHA